MSTKPTAYYPSSHRTAPIDNRVERENLDKLVSKIKNSDVVKKFLDNCQISADRLGFGLRQPQDKGDPFIFFFDTASPSDIHDMGSDGYNQDPFLKKFASHSLTSDDFKTPSPPKATPGKEESKETKQKKGNKKTRSRSSSPTIINKIYNNTCHGSNCNSANNRSNHYGKSSHSTNSDHDDPPDSDHDHFTSSSYTPPRERNSSFATSSHGNCVTREDFADGLSRINRTMIAIAKAMLNDGKRQHTDSASHAHIEEISDDSDVDRYESTPLASSNSTQSTSTRHSPEAPSRSTKIYNAAAGVFGWAWSSIPSCRSTPENLLNEITHLKRQITTTTASKKALTPRQIKKFKNAHKGLQEKYQKENEKYQDWKKAELEKCDSENSYSGQLEAFVKEDERRNALLLSARTELDKIGTLIDKAINARAELLARFNRNNDNGGGEGKLEEEEDADNDTYTQDSRPVRPEEQNSSRSLPTGKRNSSSAAAAGGTFTESFPAYPPTQGQGIQRNLSERSAIDYKSESGSKSEDGAPIEMNSLLKYEYDLLEAKKKANQLD